MTAPKSPWRLARTSKEGVRNLSVFSGKLRLEETLSGGSSSFCTTTWIPFRRRPKRVTRATLGPERHDPTTHTKLNYPLTQSRRKQGLQTLRIITKTFDTIGRPIRTKKVHKKSKTLLAWRSALSQPNGPHLRSQKKAIDDCCHLIHDIYPTQ